MWRHFSEQNKNRVSRTSAVSTNCLPPLSLLFVSATPPPDHLNLPQNWTLLIAVEKWSVNIAHTPRGLQSDWFMTEFQSKWQASCLPRTLDPKRKSWKAKKKKKIGKQSQKKTVLYDIRAKNRRMVLGESWPEMPSGCVPPTFQGV